jgi:hypothetical protein
MEPVKFRLNEFKAVAKWLDKHLPLPVAFFLKGWLWGLEDRYIDAKVSSALEEAIAPHRPPEPSLEAPTFTSEPSEVEGLDTISLHNDFIERTPGSDR